MKNKLFTLSPLRQGIEIQSVSTDDMGDMVPGPHELQAEVNGIPVTIAYVDSAEQVCSMDDLPEIHITKDEQIAILHRLAHCWNVHDELVHTVHTLLDIFIVNKEADIAGSIKKAKAVIARAEA